jgi:tetratricopeptide (TPR) repeat protein
LEVGIAYECIARILYTLDRYGESLAMCDKAIEVLSAFSKENPLEYALTLATKGGVLIELGEYEKALQCHTKTLQIRQDHLGIHSHVGRSMHANTICLRALGRYVEAMKYHDDGLEIYKKTCGSDHPWFFASLQNKAWTMLENGGSKEALKIFQQVLAYLAPIQGEKHGDLVESWQGIGWSHFRLGNFKQAKEAFNVALENGAIYENSRSLLQTLKGLGWSHLKDGEVDQGLDYLSRQLQMGAKMYQNSPRMHLILSDFRKALEEAGPTRSTEIAFELMNQIQSEL